MDLFILSMALGIFIFGIILIAIIMLGGETDDKSKQLFDQETQQYRQERVDRERYIKKDTFRNQKDE